MQRLCLYIGSTPGGGSANDVSFRRCRIGGAASATDLGAKTLIKLGAIANTVIEDCALTSAAIGIQGALTNGTGEWVNGLLIRNVTFSGSFTDVPMFMGGQGITIDRTSIEARVFDDAASGLRCTAFGINGLNFTSNFWQDAVGTGVWFDAWAGGAGGGVRGAFFGGNYFHNGLDHMDIRGSEGLAIIGNVFNVYDGAKKPIQSSTNAKRISAFSNTMLARAGQTIPPGLFVTTPDFNSGPGLVDNMDGVGLRILGQQVATRRTVLAAGGTGGLASMAINVGTAPTTPINGDVWFDGTDLWMRVGGVSKKFTLT